MKQFMCKCVWNMSEATGIGLGRLAPWVFGNMIGAKSWHEVKLDAPDLENEAFSIDGIDFQSGDWKLVYGLDNTFNIMKYEHHEDLQETSWQVISHDEAQKLYGIVTCGRCEGIIQEDEAEVCWWCNDYLCEPCWDMYGECGHEEVEARMEYWKNVPQEDTNMHEGKLIALALFVIVMSVIGKIYMMAQGLPR